MLRRFAPVLIALVVPALTERPAPPIRLVLAPTGNEVRYKVREQLADVNFPTDAVGATSAVTGALVINGDGTVDTAASKFTIDLTGLKSDRDRRDHFIQGRTLETAQYPNAVLAPTALRGLTLPLPRSGTLTFQLAGALTVHGVTKPSTWQVTAEAKDGRFSGLATTSVKFEDFGMTPPRVMVVLSVDDSIRLEYSFNLVRAR